MGIDHAIILENFEINGDLLSCTLNTSKSSNLLTAAYTNNKISSEEIISTIDAFVILNNEKFFKRRLFDICCCIIYELISLNCVNCMDRLDVQRLEGRTVTLSKCQSLDSNLSICYCAIRVEESNQRGII